MYVMGKKETKERLRESRLADWQHVASPKRGTESHLWSKLANPPTVEVISIIVISIRAYSSPNICLFVIALESAYFICQLARFLAQYLRKFSDRLKNLLLNRASLDDWLCKEDNNNTNSNNNALSILKAAKLRLSSTNLKSQLESSSCQCWTLLLFAIPRSRSRPF